MGFALPAAIASCLADPRRRAVAFTGDGGLMMCLGELGTAIQEKCAPIVVVFNDSALTLIGAKQRRRRLAPAGVDFVDVDFAQIARGFGWDAQRVERSDDLAPAFGALPRPAARRSSTSSSILRSTTHRSSRCAAELDETAEPKAANAAYNLA